MWKWVGRIICHFRGHQWPDIQRLGDALYFLYTDHTCPRCGYEEYAYTGTLIPDKIATLVLESLIPDTIYSVLNRS
jgi:hypothetical protein